MHIVEMRHRGGVLGAAMAQIKAFLPLCTLLAALAFMLSTARADDMDGWCAQVKKASSIVICSDPELRQGAIARNKLFEAAREKLGPEVYRALTENQSRWIKSYTARCGVAIDDPPPTLPIAQSVIDCYRRESRARTAYLATRLSEPNPLASMPASLPTAEQAFGPPPQANSPAASWKAPDTPWKAAQDQWKKCLTDSAVRLADQPESAAIVAEAAIGSCGKSETDFMQASIESGALTYTGFMEIRRLATDQLLARVMAIRQARRDAVGAAVAAHPGKYFDDLARWLACTRDAAIALAAQPEPAQTVADAALASCLEEEGAHQRSAGLSNDQLDEIKRKLVAPRTLAEVMAVRAARAKLRQHTPPTKPATNYDRM